MSLHRKNKNTSVAVLSGILLVMIAALIALSVMYLNSDEPSASGDPASSEASQEVSREAASSEQPPVSDTSAESELSSESQVSSEENTSSEIIVDDDPLVNANRTTKGTEEFPYYITINRTQNIVVVYTMDEEGYYSVPYKAFVCSVGLPDEDGVIHTPIGTFNTTNQYTWRLLQGNVYGQYATRIVDHILFHSVPYFEQSKDTLEWEEYNKLGQAASLGCVRLTVEDAKWIYDNCPKGTTVTIYESDRTEPFEKPVAPTIPEESPNRDWDPTDPDPENPWRAE